jgi:hypothetical protein
MNLDLARDPDTPTNARLQSARQPGHLFKRSFSNVVTLYDDVYTWRETNASGGLHGATTEQRTDMSAHMTYLNAMLRRVLESPWTAMACC